VTLYFESLVLFFHFQHCQTSHFLYMLPDSHSKIHLLSSCTIHSSHMLVWDGLGSLIPRGLLVLCSYFLMATIC